MKNKIVFIFFALFAFSAFAIDVTTDVFLGGFYNHANVFTGKAKYQKNISYDTVTIDGDYNAVFSAAGGSLGFDCFFNPSSFGVYLRSGFFKVFDVKRTAAGVTDKIKNTQIGYNMFFDVGGIYAFNFGNVSLNIAPALSILSVQAQNMEKIYSRTTIDALLGFGLSADVSVKYRYKYFVCSAGCTSSFYPLTLVSSADTKISYSTNIRNTMAYNLRPYIAFGFSLREITSSVIKAGGND